MAIQPDVRAIIDAVEVERDALSAHRGRNAESRPAPPWHGVRTLRIHGGVDEVRADRECRTRDLAQIHPEEWITVNAVFNERPDDRGRHRRAIPISRSIRDGGNRRAIGPHFCRRLDLPAVVEHQSLLRRRRGRYREKQNHRQMRDPRHYAASTRPNGQRLVFHDQSKNATNPSASTPIPNRITSTWVVANTNIHPSSAITAGTG